MLTPCNNFFYDLFLNVAFCSFMSSVESVLLSTSVDIFSASRMRDLSGIVFHCAFVATNCAQREYVLPKNHLNGSTPYFFKYSQEGRAFDRFVQNVQEMLIKVYILSNIQVSITHKVRHL